MIKINVNKVKGYEFEGTVSIIDLPHDILDNLKIDRDQHPTDDLEVLGSFDGYSDGDDSSIEQVELTIYGAQNGETHKAPIGKVTDLTEPIRTVRTIWGEVPSQYSLDIQDDDRFDLENVCEQILDMSDTYEWYMDRMERQADAMYDSWKEGN